MLSRSGKDLEYFSSDADLLLNLKQKNKTETHKLCECNRRYQIASYFIYGYELECLRVGLSNRLLSTSHKVNGPVIGQPQLLNMSDNGNAIDSLAE